MNAHFKKVKMSQSTFRLYPRTKLTINPVLYSNIDDEYRKQSYQYDYHMINTNREYEKSALEDIYDEDERKTVLKFRWDKPGYIRQQKMIGGCYIKGLYNDVDSSISESLPSSMNNSIIDISELSIINSDINDVNIDGSDELDPLSYSHTPSELIELEELSVESGESELDITALADAFDELVAVNEQHTSDEETEINSGLIEYY